MKLTLLIGIVLGILLFPAGSVPARDPSESDVRAALLLNLPRFIEWKGGTFPDDATPLVIGVLGDEAFGEAVRAMANTRKAQGRSIDVRLLDDSEQMEECQLLYLSAPSGPKRRALLRTVERKSIVTVGSAEGFAEDGGMIHFTTQSQKTRIRVNLDAANKAGIHISSKLLRLAEIVQTQRGKS